MELWGGGHLTSGREQPLGEELWDVTLLASCLSHGPSPQPGPPRLSSVSVLFSKATWSSRQA